MDKELKIKLIEGLARMDEGVAVREIIEEFIYETCNVSNIPKEILNGDKDRLVSEVVGRLLAKKYLEVLTKSLKPLFKKENIKRIIR
ncbi:MAG: hypothetical protein PHS34_07615 [Candidatus Omnitrophica bacterium]|nr:hypothetical protein [Candidatus Omnitrophota bacterium]MDD5551109.1 hypothetical protein [Candidatus Omnitrophota bacterium]